MAESKFLEDYRQMQRSDFKHFFQEKTRWGDADMLGHINNVLYARYYESARLSYLREALAIDFINPDKTGIILADMKIAYLKQLHHPASMSIGARISRIGNSSLQLDAAVFIDADKVDSDEVDADGHEQQVISTSRATLVWFDYANNKALKIPESQRQMIAEFEIIPPVLS